jgi:hypothetical protein
MTIHAYEIERAEEQVGNLRREYLRGHGWTETCQVPGSYWLWSGRLPDGREVLCDEETAFGLQDAMTPDPEDDEGD